MTPEEWIAERYSDQDFSVWDKYREWLLEQVKEDSRK